MTNLLQTKRANPNAHPGSAFGGISLLSTAAKSLLPLDTRIAMVKALVEAGARINHVDFLVTVDRVAPVTALDFAIGFIGQNQPNNSPTLSKNLVQKERVKHLGKKLKELLIV